MKWLARIQLLLLMVLLAPSTQAKLYTSPVLSEAAKLVEINPKQAQLIAEKYLSQRKLTENSAKGPSAIPREETDTTLRSPNSSIDAYHILAESHYLQGKPKLALRHIDTAIELADRHNLPFVRLETYILKAELLWRQTHDPEKADKLLDQVEDELEYLPAATQLGNSLYYELAMLRGEIDSTQGARDDAERQFMVAADYLVSMNSVETDIQYHLSVGQHYLRYRSYDNALTELLTSYWKAVEQETGLYLAQANYQLAQLFMQRQVLDKALEHLIGAADFYGKFDQSRILADVLKQMADIYFQQGKYNLALVHYFNVLDHEYFSRDMHDVIDLRLSIADTYMQLFNFPLAERYLDKAKNLVAYTELKPLKARAMLLTAELAIQQNHLENAVKNANQALEVGMELESNAIMRKAYLVLSNAFQKQSRFSEALAAMRQHSILAATQEKRINQINEDVLRQQKEIIEQSLHYKGLEEELTSSEQRARKFQKTSLALFAVSLLFVLITLRRGYVVDKYKKQVKSLTQDLYTHTRSGLQNLRMLNIKLPGSLKRSSDTFEQWQTGELINEPFSDRLRFAMFELPLLRYTYLEQGYKAGLSLEKEFGDYIKSRIQEPARLYHFSDAMFLYVEPNTDTEAKPQAMFDKICSWISDFEPERKISSKVRVGMADYPFLPRAYTAINDQELIDILLMSTHLARSLELGQNSEESQWVYLRAIESAPAASFATDDIRLACKQAMNQGLIKAYSAPQNEEDLKKLTLSD
ncbi:tetratricopeptide repeat protein [Vibrio sp. SCSIO 43136]|uniref:tetratricopeptide repeat protein n=1 Tax=Vibrio sp. SCSIO 43136 TaxID=2819101 RepID=UPI00207619C5|nr:tetratricopeptide repeat protein [Vibrio sp. SCSIO 43136]USD65885.1 tetratricopeptide repeat protein [Vibrio sp. SCSIO 43136]